MEDIIITVLALALGLGFKVVEKKLKSAGQGPVTDHEVKPVIPEVKPVIPEVKPVIPEVKPVIPEVKPVRRPVVVPDPSEEAPRVFAPSRKPVLQEEPMVKREKVDPKKLVIYSEIMKPKYLE